MKLSANRSLPLLVACLLAAACLFTTACSVEVETGGDQPQAASTQATAQAGDSGIDAAAVESKLVAADLVDGTADHVVTRCAGCALGMNGSPEHALDVSGYELHFCSDYCKTTFAKAPEKNVAKLTIPK